MYISHNQGNRASWYNEIWLCNVRVVESDIRFILQVYIVYTTAPTRIMSPLLIRPPGFSHIPNKCTFPTTKFTVKVELIWNVLLVERDIRLILQVYIVYTTAPTRIISPLLT